MSIDEVHGKLSSEPVAEFAHPCILIKINDTYSDTTKLGAIELYDATRGTWKVSRLSAGRCRTRDVRVPGCRGPCSRASC